jgi:hypothetical protein
MSNRVVMLPLLLALTVSPVRGAIDFTPAIQEYTHAGFQYRKVTFKDGERIISFSPPQGWAIRGAKDRVQLMPPDKSFVDATITAAPLSHPQPFDDAAMKALEQQVLASAPEPSQSVQLVSVQQNPVVMGANLSCEVVISYVNLGQVFYRSVLVVHTPDTQLIFRLTAPKAEFARLNEPFRRSITSWQWASVESPGGDRASAAPQQR